MSLYHMLGGIVLEEKTLANIRDDINAAYYLIHSISTSNEDEKPEEISTQNFNTI